MAKERIVDVVERLADPLATELGYELVEIDYGKQGPDWVLLCTIDQSAGVTTDDCQRFSHALEALLDEQDPIPGSYLLEVSSPGLERPLKRDADFERFTGQMIEVKMRQAIHGHKQFQGQLAGIGGAGSEKTILLKINDSMVEIPRNDVVKAHLIAEIFAAEGGKRRK